MTKPQISFIIPLYNEEEVFQALFDRMNELLQGMEQSAEILLVDDGSRDNTPLLIRNAVDKNPAFKGLILSRNYGHQTAISAGMAHAQATEAVMILDGDLQDPPELFHEFYKKLQEGYDIAFGIRRKRKESILKKMAYWAFYRLLKKISNTDIALDSGDFCMMNTRVNKALVDMPERSRFIRGMRSWIGFNQIGVTYERDPRAAGEPKYDFRKLFKLAYDGIFNFSEVPLKTITRLGLLTTLVSSLYLTFVVVRRLLGHDLPQGYTATLLVITLFSGVQLISLGVIGEYIARIYVQVKERPLYLVKEIMKKEYEYDQQSEQ